MDLLKLFLVIAIFVIFYSYIGYGIVVWFLIRLRSLFKRKELLPDKSFFPPVSLIVAAYNEEEFIEEKIKNTLELEYPKENLQIIFVTDGSSDKTPDIVKLYPSIQLLHKPERLGKVAAMGRAMEFVTTPYVIFSDANTLLNKESLKNIIRHYQSPDVGGVAGEKKVIGSMNNNIAGVGEGLYWKYESFLKKLDSEFYTVVGAAGELFSVRTNLYAHPGNGIILDDFLISLDVCRKGYRIVYEPSAFALETPSASIKEEQKRKIRIGAGAFQSMVLLKDLLNILKYPKLSFQYISHRVLRWAVCPFLLPIIFFTNFFLMLWDDNIWITSLFICQLLCYFGAAIGWYLFSKNIKHGFFYALFYFLFINYTLYLGLVRFLKGKQTVLWEKASRQNSQEQQPFKILNEDHHQSRSHA